MTTQATPMAKVQEQMMAELFEKGPEHFLTWIGGWYSAVADAKVAEELTMALGPFATNQEAVDAYLAEKLPAAAAYVDNKSGTGSGVVERAVVAAYAKRLRNIHNRNARSHLDTVLAKLQAQAANAPAG